MTDIITRQTDVRDRVRTSWTETGPPARRRRAFVVLSAAVLTQMMTAPGQTVGISVFVDHLVTDLDLSRSGVSAAYLVGTGAGALSLPLAGRLIDRRGLRWATTAFAAAFGAVLVAMAGVAGFATLALGFAGTRMLGQGALTLTASTTIAVSFDRHRGTAMGIKTALGGGLMSLIPLVAAGLIAAVGWRTTFAILGVSVWLILLPLARWVVADPRPVEAISISPTALAVGDSQRPGSAWQLSEVVRHPMFWVMTAAVSLSALVSTGLVFHQIGLLVERGLTPGQAAGNFVPQTIAAALASLWAGRLADRVSANVLVPGAMVLLAASPMLLQVARPGVLAVLYGVVLGAAGGSIRTIEASVLPRWFGVAHIGEIRGVILAAAVGASSVGPLLVSTLGAMLDGYGPVLNLLAGASITVALLAAVGSHLDRSSKTMG